MAGSQVGCYGQSIWAGSDDGGDVGVQDLSL